jgi:hypothetical protein
MGKERDMTYREGSIDVGNLRNIAVNGISVTICDTSTEMPRESPACTQANICKTISGLAIITVLISKSRNNVARQKLK